MAGFKTDTIACHLVCLQNNHDPILLPHGQSVIIGRTPETKITSPLCSRQQVSLTADWNQRQAKVQQLGPNPSSVDGTIIGKNESVTLKSSSVLFIVSGSYPHRIIFKTSQKGGLNKSVADSSPEEKNNKRKHSEETKSSDAKKKKIHVSNKEADRHNKSEHENGKKESSTGREEESNSDEENKMKAAKLKEFKSKALLDKSQASHAKHHSSTSSPSTSSSKSKPTTSSNSQAAEKSSWASKDNLYVFTSKGVVAHRKIAAFDLDGTIIKTKSGKVFPTSLDDWELFHPCVTEMLRDLISKSFKIVFFTNQMGVSKGKTKVEDIKSKIENVVKRLQVPVQVFMATHEGLYRKPNDGMWDALKGMYNKDKEINIPDCFYVGDAAGREADWAPKRKKDFSCSDRLFALNVGVKFFTPEEYFFKQKATKKFVMPSFDPRALISDFTAVPADAFANKGKELIVLVGLPGCGKSHFSSTVLQQKGYKLVSRDRLKTWQKCVEKAKQYLAHSSVAIDNTNLMKEERARYIKLARDAKVPCRCFVFTTTLDHCRHNEIFRRLSGGEHAKINEMIFNKMKSSYQEPSMGEGFSNLINVKFVPQFKSESDEVAYRKFLLEK